MCYFPIICQRFFLIVFGLVMCAFKQAYCIWKSGIEFSFFSITIDFKFNSKWTMCFQFYTWFYHVKCHHYQCHYRTIHSFNQSMITVFFCLCSSSIWLLLLLPTNCVRFGNLIKILQWTLVEWEDATPDTNCICFLVDTVQVFYAPPNCFSPKFNIQFI